MTQRLITKEEALQVARADAQVGVLYAIETLDELGFDCTPYWKWLDNVDINDEDLDEKNLEHRDELFKSLGEENNKRIQEAYEIAWNE